MWLTSFFIGKRERPRVGETRRVSNREIDSPYFSSESRRAPPVDDIVSTIVLPLNMSRMLCGRQIDRSTNYFRKKVGGSLSVCGAFVFHRWRSESLPAHQRLGKPLLRAKLSKRVLQFLVGTGIKHRDSLQKSWNRS